MNINKIHSLFLTCSSIATDTRKIEKDCFFVALKGDNFDANTFAQKALAEGAKYAVIDNSNYYIDDRTILVKNSLETLQELAKYHRKFLGLPIIALSGSNGKTTTKELINVVLSKRYNTIATVGNLNNHIGVPLTLLRFTKQTEIGIVEMGANHQKEIELLCSITQPDYGYITNFGKAHLEGFGGIEGVIKGKSEIFKHLENNKKLAFINLDDSIQKEKSENLNRFTFSTTQEADVIITKVEANPMVKIEFKGLEIQSNLIGIYNANNINAAITIGTYFEVSEEDIKDALENYIPENNRSQLIHKNRNEIILDAYNANPSSMQAAITNFIQLDKSNKIAILGDMFELGTESFEEHRKIVKLIDSEAEIRTYFVGKHFYANKTESNHILFFEDYNAFSHYFKNLKPSNSLLLIKGSRGMALEKALEII